VRSASLLGAVSIVLVANALALFHAARNRAGSPEAEITLTNRELNYFDQSSTDDDSGVTLHLQWTDPSIRWIAGDEKMPNWLDRQKLRTLGFDCSVDPANAGAARFYERQRPRQAFVALEFDGAAWRTFAEKFDRRRTATESGNSIAGSAAFSRLVPIDAELDPVKLRARYPDRRTVLILPAVVGIALDTYPFPGRIVEIGGHLLELPSSINVPRPFNKEFHSLERFQPAVRPQTNTLSNLIYSVSLSYGSSLEPWVTGVEFANAQ
jgi:hypothetical protein